MKRILITGKNSYVGNSFERYMSQFSDSYVVDTISLRDDRWKEVDFSIYDSIYHVAGIAHADVAKVDAQTKKLYYDVNCELAYETAQKYKNDLAGKKGQFIYMSSIIIYGEETNINKKRVITPDTEPNPSNFYGDSKLQAELKLAPLNSNNFKIAIVRPPMIYGPNSKGNFPQLVKIAEKAVIFPKVDNQRSMLFIGNLCIFIKEIIDKRGKGIYFPQNNEYVQTSDLVRVIRESLNNKIIMIPYFSWIIKILGFIPGKVGKLTNKAFGNLVYEKQNQNKEFLEFNDTIKISLGIDINE